MKQSIGAKTIMYPAPVLVVGTYDKEGRPNVATASWGGICCSQPPCVAVSLRKATLSFQNIMDQKAFTVSIPSETHLKAVDFLGLVSGRTVDKWAEAKLTPIKSKVVNAPFVKEFGVALECRVVDVAEIGLHTQFIGEIVDVKVDEEMLGPSGAVDIKKLNPIIYTMDTQEYYGVGERLGQVFSVGRNL